MAQQDSFQLHTSDPSFSIPQNEQGFIVLNQQTSSSSGDGSSHQLQLEWVYRVSIRQCAVAIILLIAGSLSIFKIDFSIWAVSSPIWCNTLVLANGIVGYKLSRTQRTYLINAFLGLSIASFILTTVTLVLYITVLVYVTKLDSNCLSNHGHYNDNCDWNKNRMFGIVLCSIIIPLTVYELICAVAATISSSQALCKCCTTCKVNDCRSYLGCCESNTRQLDVAQDRIPDRPNANLGHSIVPVNWQLPTYQQAVQCQEAFSGQSYYLQQNMNAQSRVTPNSPLTTPGMQRYQWLEFFGQFITDSGNSVNAQSNGCPLPTVNATVEISTTNHQEGHSNVQQSTN